jgi:hypothetical protein
MRIARSGFSRRGRASRRAERNQFHVQHCLAELAHAPAKMLA